jgi:hypothetical protein
VTLALTYWHTVRLPKPKPAVPPGWAITGLPAYLVTDGSTSAAYNTNTVLGPLHLAAHGTYWVRWNDPTSSASWQGPYTSEGQPYPAGAITHIYDNVGSYTVIVRETWTATWTLGPARGVLAGLVTQAIIPDLNVQQIQAVITNN